MEDKTFHREMYGTCSEPGPWTSHSFTITVSETFLLPPVLLPRRVFTNTGGWKISSLFDASVIDWALLAFSSSSTAAGCFSSACKSRSQRKWMDLEPGGSGISDSLILPDFPPPSADNAAWSLWGVFRSVIEQENQVCALKGNLLSFKLLNKLYYLHVRFKSELLGKTLQVCIFHWVKIHIWSFPLWFHSGSRTRRKGVKAAPRDRWNPALSNRAAGAILLAVAEVPSIQSKLTLTLRQRSNSPHGGSIAPCWLILISNIKQKKKHPVLLEVRSNALAGQTNLQSNIGGGGGNHRNSHINMEFNGSMLTHSVSNIEPSNVGKMGQCPMTLHCHHCNSVLADSVGICGDFKYLDSIVCLSMLPYFLYHFLSQRCNNFFVEETCMYNINMFVKYTVPIRFCIFSCRISVTSGSWSFTKVLFPV